MVGGILTDTLSWRWNFYVFVPFALVGLVVIQKTLTLPPRPSRKVSVDYLGAVLIAAGVITLLLWVSLAGDAFAWWSAPTLWMVGGAVVALALAIWVEVKAEEPIIPLHLFGDRTFSLAVVGSIAVGVAMFGTSIFLSQYMQFARGATPTLSGLMTLPMVAGQMVGGIGGGNLISRWGRWKSLVVTGGVLTTAGLLLMGTIHYNTEFVLVSCFMFVLGLGVGLIMQNLVLVVQNSVDPRHLGAASAGVTFFRTLGGSIGVSVIGAGLAARVPTLIQQGLAALSPADRKGLELLQGGQLPDLASLPAPIRIVVENAYGVAIAESFWHVVPLAVIALLAIIALPNRPLSRRTASQRLRHKAENISLELADAAIGNDSPESVEAALRLTGPAHRSDERLTVDGEGRVS
ncbi:MAG: MFS transporter [Propionicimonas sp.]|nr:MFS transporter [Propionicimonas sp.]